MDIRPIKTEADYQAALAQIEGLFDAMPNTPAGDRLDVLATLVEAYEEQHYSIPAPDPIDAIMYHMEGRGLSRRDLEPYLGSRARVAEVLNRKRPLSLEMVRRLQTGLGIAAEILIQPYALATPAPNETVEKAQEGHMFSAGFLSEARKSWPERQTCRTLMSVCSFLPVLYSRRSDGQI